MPFFINKYGTLIWTNDKGQFHREDGPAFIRLDHYKEYWQNGHLHREEGPAYIYPNGYKAYWLNHKAYSEENYYKALKAIK